MQKKTPYLETERKINILRCCTALLQFGLRKWQKRIFKGKGEAAKQKLSPPSLAPPLSLPWPSTRDTRSGVVVVVFPPPLDFPDVLSHILPIFKNAFFHCRFGKKITARPQRVIVKMCKDTSLPRRHSSKRSPPRSQDFYFANRPVRLRHQGRFQKIIFLSITNL